MKLTDEQLQYITPELAKLQQLEQEKQEVSNRLQRMLCLIEPRFCKQDGGVSFDMTTMSFTEKSFTENEDQNNGE